MDDLLGYLHLWKPPTISRLFQLFQFQLKHADHFIPFSDLFGIGKPDHLEMSHDVHIFSGLCEPVFILFLGYVCAGALRSKACARGRPKRFCTIHVCHAAIFGISPRPGECTCPFPLMKRDLMTQESRNDQCEDFWCFLGKPNWAKL